MRYSISWLQQPLLKVGGKDEPEVSRELKSRPEHRDTLEHCSAGIWALGIDAIPQPGCECQLNGGGGVEKGRSSSPTAAED